jgi:hypothetical protein
MKWLGMIKVVGHPSLLPLAISTFISIAGPGGVAEISRHAPAVATLPTTFDAPLVVAPPSEPLVLVLRPVPHQPGNNVAPVEPAATFLHAETPGEQTEPVTEISIVSDQFTSPDNPQPEPVVPADEAGVTEPVAPPIDEGEDPAQPPVHEPSGDAGNDPGNDEGDTGGGTGDDGIGDDGSDGDSDEPVCDPPGTGPAPHEGVPPGHDQNGDGIDDRCQDGAGDDGSGDGSDGDGTGETGDDGTGTDDDGTGTGDDADEPVCDPPGRGPDPHDGVPPGHDKNEDGIDDRCQEGVEEGEPDVCPPADNGTGNGNANGNGNGANGSCSADPEAGANDPTDQTANDGKDKRKTTAR